MNVSSCRSFEIYLNYNLLRLCSNSPLQNSAYIQTLIQPVCIANAHSWTFSPFSGSVVH